MNALIMIVFVSVIGAVKIEHAGINKYNFTETNQDRAVRKDSNFAQANG